MVAARTPNITRAPTKVRSAPANTTKRATPRRKSAHRSWESKLRPELAPRVVEDGRRGGRLLLPTPLLLADVIASIPRGSVLTIGQLRSALAERFEAATTCPLMTGVFARILAGVVVEDLAQRHKPRVPIWRLVRDDGTLHPNWPLDPL